MQKSLGIAALAVAIISIFIPFVGTWLTILVALLAVFAYGPGFKLGMASIIINVVHIFFFSPLLWATQMLAEAGAAMSGQDVAFLPWFLVLIQIGAGILLLVLHNKFKPAKSDFQQPN